MTTLLDTNILVRLANAADPLYATADRAVQVLHGRGDVLYVTPQNFVEFRNVATRPKALNGLGLSAAEADAKAAGFELLFPLLSDVPGIFPAWKVVVAAAGVVGKQVHDARLVAVCHAHSVSHLLTFNVGHFSRLVAAGPPVTVLDPATV